MRAFFFCLAVSFPSGSRWQSVPQGTPCGTSEKEKLLKGRLAQVTAPEPCGTTTYQASYRKASEFLPTVGFGFGLHSS